MTSGSGQEFAALFADLLRKGEDRTAAAVQYVAMLDRHGQAAKRADVTYRCPRRCTLLRVYATGAGVVIAKPRYKLSPAVSDASSTPDGRAKNTEDGARRWRKRAFFLDQAMNVSLDCDHLRAHLLPNERIEADLLATRREVVVTR